MLVIHYPFSTLDRYIINKLIIVIPGIKPGFNLFVIVIFDYSGHYFSSVDKVVS